jgi:hypothetical protein
MNYDDIFKIDGKKLLDLFILSKASETGDRRTVEILKVFHKYGLSIMDGFALMMEILSLIPKDKEEEEKQ